MSTVQYSIVGSADEQFVTAFVPGEAQPLVAAKSGHPRFDAIVAAVQSGDVNTADLVALFDISAAVAEKFKSLSDRVQVGNSRVLFDGEEVDSSITRQIVRVLEEDGDFQSLVNFMEKVMDNPEPHSREQLFDWLKRRDFTITVDGDIVAYKGVHSDGNGSYRSISSGSEDVLVDGVVHRGRIPNPIGAVVNMARGLVQHDPAVGCHRGLHVGTYDYAKSFSYGTVLEVHVNPRDIVSVPTDCEWAKVRCCRYTVVDVIDGPYQQPVLGKLDDDGDDLEVWEDFAVGDRVKDEEGDIGTVYCRPGVLRVRYDDDQYGDASVDDYGFVRIAEDEPEEDWDF